MSDFVLISDSTADMPVSFYKEHDIRILQLRYSIDGEEFYDNLNETNGYRAFYAKLRGGKVSTTAQVNAEEFIEVFHPILESGKDLLYTGLGSALSGTYQGSVSAAETLAQEFPDRKVRVVDSLGAVHGITILLQIAVDMRNEGKNADEVADMLEAERNNVQHWVLADDLFHLRRGGRLSSSSAVLGTLLKVKPILYVNTKGQLIVAEKARGRKKGIQTLLDHLRRDTPRLDSDTVGVAYADCEDEASSLMDRIKKEFAFKRHFFCSIGAVIGSHIGPGTIALFYKAGPRTI